MIASLRGKLLDNDGETVVVEVAGVGYQVYVSAAALGALPPTNAEVFLHVHSHFVTDEPIRLYGFMDAADALAIAICHARRAPRGSRRRA